MIKMPPINKHKVQFFVYMLIVSVMTGCGGAKTPIDKSADYKSARSLPPLQKPQRQSSVVIDKPKPSVPDVQTRTIESPKPSSVIANEQDNQTLSVDSELATSSIGIVGQVVETGSEAVRLQVDADFELAWNFLSEQLQGSKITVFSRNKDAGRIAIGCGDADRQASVSRSGGWSIFRRDKKQISDYCALQLDERRRGTIVTLLDRHGDEIESDYSASVFSQLSNQ